MTLTVSEILYQFSSVFTILGQCSYPAERSAVTKKHTTRVKYLRRITVILIMLAIFFVTKNTFKYIYYTQYYRETDNLLYSMMMMFLLISNVCVLQSVHHGSSLYATLYKQILTLEQMTRSKYLMCFQHFRRIYFFQIFMVVGSHLFAGFINFIYVPGTFMADLININVLILSILTTIPTFHVVFYINIMQHMQRCFTKYLASHGYTLNEDGVVDARIIRKQLIFLKQTYFSLWEISQTINRLFGLVLTFLILRNFVHVVYDSYWIFMLLITTDDPLDMLRNVTPRFNL